MEKARASGRNEFKSIEDPENYTFREEPTKESYNMMIPTAIFNRVQNHEELEQVDEYFNNGQGVDLNEEFEAIQNEEELSDQIAMFHEGASNYSQDISSDNSERDRRVFYRNNLNNFNNITPERRSRRQTLMNERAVRMRDMGQFSCESIESQQSNFLYSFCTCKLLVFY